MTFPSCHFKQGQGKMTVGKNFFERSNARVPVLFVFIRFPSIWLATVPDLPVWTGENTKHHVLLHL
jgi:hypothetical protein